MKILFVIPNYSGTGGAETVISTVCKELENRSIDYHIYVAAKRKPKHREARDDSWLDDLKHSRGHFPLNIRILREHYHVKNIAKTIDDLKINKIIAVDGTCLRIARSAINKTKKDIPLFSWAHITIQKVKENNSLTLADHHLAICNKISQQIEQLGVDKSKISTVYNPIYRQQSEIPFNPENLLFLGRLRESHKQFSLILTALAKVHGNWTLHVIGDGDDMEMYKNQAEQLELSSKVIFHGFIKNPWNYIENEIKSIGALLLSSKTEGFGMVLCEAMSYGIYCISSDCETGPNEIINRGLNGQLFDVGDAEALGAHIQKIVNNTVSIDHGKIKQSIDHFYIDSYMRRLIQALTAS